MSVGLATEPAALAVQFASQEDVDRIVEAADRDQLLALTDYCRRWRGNGIAKLLHPDEQLREVLAPTGLVLLSDAESGLQAVFARHRRSLIAIAADPDVLADPAYCERDDPIAVRICLARPGPDFRSFMIFDGIHRAIRMAREGDSTIPLLVVG